MRVQESVSGVVLMGTVASRIGMNFHSSIASEKEAVEGLAKSLAAEYAVKKGTVQYGCTLKSRFLSRDDESSKQCVHDSRDCAELPECVL